MTAARHAERIGPDATDAELAVAATSGDRGAFALIYDRYADKLHDFCVGMLRDRDAAADCVQDAFCTAATKLTELREPDKLRPWLYSVTRNEALRRIRDRRRELLSDEVPDMASTEAGPEVLAARTELAELIAEAAGGLSDRDRAVLQLAYHHGMDGPELAEALEVSPSAATKMVQRLRDTVERSLGALLVCRRAKADPEACPELATVLEGWDGTFTVLMRKRVARHIESCPICDEERRLRVTPAALLGASPVLVPAPGWLRERTLEAVELPSGTTSSGPGAGAAAGSRRPWAITAALVAGLALIAILVWVLTRQGSSAPVVPADVNRTETTTTTVSRPPAGLIPAPAPTTTPTTIATTPTSIAAPPPPPSTTEPVTTTERRLPQRRDVTTTAPSVVPRSPTQREEEPEPEVTEESTPTDEPSTSRVTTSRVIPKPPTQTFEPATTTTTPPGGPIL
jgi:RNA polymerase sigma factor (sigma-70 family)